MSPEHIRDGIYLWARNLREDARVAVQRGPEAELLFARRIRQSPPTQLTTLLTGPPFEARLRRRGIHLTDTHRAEASAAAEGGIDAVAELFQAHAFEEVRDLLWEVAQTYLRRARVDLAQAGENGELREHEREEIQPRERASEQARAGAHDDAHGRAGSGSGSEQQPDGAGRFGSTIDSHGEGLFDATNRSTTDEGNQRW